MKKKLSKILEYNVIFSLEEDGGYSAFVPDLPGCVSQGETFEEAKSNIKEAIELYLEDGSNPIFEVTSSQSRRQFMAPIAVKV